MTPNDRAPKLARKPRDTIFTYCGATTTCAVDSMMSNVWVGGRPLDVDSCRKLSDWLTKAADYLDSKKVRRER